jgi:hypothetical protein
MDDIDTEREFISILDYSTYLVGIWAWGPEFGGPSGDATTISRFAD